MLESWSVCRWGDCQWLWLPCTAAWRLGAQPGISPVADLTAALVALGTHVLPCGPCPPPEWRSQGPACAQRGPPNMHLVGRPPLTGGWEIEKLGHSAAIVCTFCFPPGVGTPPNTEGSELRQDKHTRGQSYLLQTTFGMHLCEERSQAGCR